MTTFQDQQNRVIAAVRAVDGWDGGELAAEPAIPVLASPSWRGVDGAPWRVRRADGASLFVKAMDPDAALTIDVACAFEAAARAAALGIGPAVHAADVASGMLVMEDLDAGWSTGTLERLLDPAIVDRILAARRAFQAGPPLPRAAGVFDEVERFYAEATAAGADLPSDADWLVAELRLAAAAIAEIDAAKVPIHGDGNVSNVMIHDDGSVRLIDWDRATTADPLEDLGSFLVEAYDQEPEARDAFIRFTGGFDERAFNRARLYGIADDLRWGLLGTLVAKKSPRDTFEFHKFASWRFVRCRMAIREPRFNETLRRV